MKKIIASAIVAAASFAGPALAADLPARMPAKALPAEVVAYNWSGFYTASSIGAAWQNIDGTFITPPPENYDTSKTRGWLGSHIGLQGQWGAWVLGIEGGWLAPISNGYDTTAFGPGCFNVTGAAGVACNSRIFNIWTVGGKAGYAFGNWMVYGAGGYANGRIDTLATLNGNGFSSSSERHGGWYAGAGVDVYVTRFMWSDLILGVEYRHIEFDSLAHVDLAPVQSKNISADVDMVMVKATFKWVGAGPLNMFK